MYFVLYHRMLLCCQLKAYKQTHGQLGLQLRLNNFRKRLNLIFSATTILIFNCILSVSLSLSNNQSTVMADDRNLTRSEILWIWNIFHETMSQND